MSELENSLGRNGKRAAVAGALVTTVGTLMLVMGGNAFAAEGDPVDPVMGAFTDMQAKATLYGGATVALVVLVTAIFFGIKMFRRGQSKA